MTHEERFERDLAAVVRDGAPDEAPPELRRRVEASLATPRPIVSTRLPLPALAAAAVVLVLVGAAIIAPRLIDEPGQSPGSTNVGTAVASPGDTVAPPATAPTASPLAEPVKGVPGSAQSGQLLTRNDGWVLTAAGGLFMTHSAGAAWRDITPALTPVEGRATVNPTDFLDPSHGLVFEQGEPHESPLVIWRTADAGVNWSRSEIQGVPIGDVAMELLTPSTGWLATDLRDQAPERQLRWTFDGGATWTAPIDLTNWQRNGSTVHDLLFINERVGFMGGQQHLQRTEDGGRTWQSVDVLGDGPKVRVGLPAFVDASHAILPVDVLGPEQETIERRIYVSDDVATDEGWDWKPAVTDDLVRQWAFASANTWIATDGRQVWTTTDGGKTFDVQPSTGLPLTLLEASLRFVDPLYGWAITVGGDPCPPSSFPLPCVFHRGMFATSDGGRTWTRL